MSKKNDKEITNNLREQILEDMLTLHEKDWHRHQTVASLSDIRKRSFHNTKAKEKELRREKEIDAIRMQPYINTIQSGLRADMILLKNKNSQWNRLYESIQQLIATMSRTDADPKLIKDDKKHLELLNSTMVGIQDPEVANALQLADAKLNALFVLRCNVLQQELANAGKALSVDDAAAVDEGGKQKQEQRQHRAVELALMRALSANITRTATNGEACSTVDFAALFASAREFLNNTVNAHVVNYQQPFAKSLNTSETTTGIELHSHITSFQRTNTRLRSCMTNQCKDSTTALHQSLLEATTLRGVKMKVAYKKLKNVLGNKQDTVKVRSFRHALSRQAGGGDAAPTGMISEWSYNSATDTYSYPQGHSGTGSLQGLELGAVQCKDVRRHAVERTALHSRRTAGSAGSAETEQQQMTTFVGRDMLHVGDECNLQWKFEINGSSSAAPTITSLRVRALSSTVGKEVVQWSIKGGGSGGSGGGSTNDGSGSGGGGGLTIKATYVPASSTTKLGCTSFVDVSKYVCGWSWFIIAAKILKPTQNEKDGIHVEDVQLFRSTGGGRLEADRERGGKKSTTGSLAKPQLVVHIGLSLGKDEGGEPGSKEEIATALKECELHGVAMLGKDAKTLMAKAAKMVDSSSKKEEVWEGKEGKK